MSWRDKGLLALGIVFVAIGIPMSFDEPSGGVPAVVLGVTMLAIPLAGRFGRGGPRSARIAGRPATVIDGSAAKIWAGRFVLTTFGVGGAALAVFGEGFDRWVGGLMAVSLLYVMGWSLTKGRGRFRIVIDARGMTWQTGAEETHAGWKELSGSSVHSVQGTPYLGDLPLESFPVDPKRLAHALRDYAARPDLRDELGTERALVRLGAGTREAVELQPHEVGEHS